MQGGTETREGLWQAGFHGSRDEESRAEEKKKKPQVSFALRGARKESSG